MDPNIDRSDLALDRDGVKAIFPEAKIATGDILRTPGLRCLLPSLWTTCVTNYYGGMISKFADEKPKCPLQMHFGEKDEGIPMSTVDEIKKKQPQAETYVYPGAAHGFYCDERASYNKDAAALAWSRTQEFLTKNMK